MPRSRPPVQYMANQTKLTYFQERFCQEYVKCGDAAKAYKKVRRVDSTWTMTDVYARQRGCYMLSGAYPLVNKRVEELRQELCQRNKEKQDLVVQELARIALSDMRELVEWDGEKVTLKSSESLNDDAAACVSEISQGRDGVKVKLWSKNDALNQLSRIFGMNKDRAELVGANGKPLIPENTPDDMEVARYLAFLLEKQSRVADSVPLTAIDVVESGAPNE